MFCYSSLLVQTGLVDEVHLSFLVVGHTHCNLDQEFSVQSKKIGKSGWIGSPLAMQELYLNAHKESQEVLASGNESGNEDKTKRRVTASIQLQYMFDWKEFFKPVVNKTIKYFQVPHRFRIRLVNNVAICQYMLFTDEDLFSEQWLPYEPPATRERETDSILQQGYIKLNELAIINGLPNLQRYLGLQGDLSNYISGSRSSQAGSLEVLNLASSLNSLMSDLVELEHAALAGQVVNMQLQRDSETQPSDNQRKLIMKEPVKHLQFNNVAKPCGVDEKPI